MFTLNAKPIRIDTDLIVGEGDAAVTVPAASLQDPATREQYGITEMPDPVRPDERMFFVIQNNDGTYAATPRPLDQVTGPVWGQIKAKRDQVKEGGVLVAGKWIHTDQASRIQHLGLTMFGASIPPKLQWKTMDGSFVLMTQSLASQVLQAVAALDMAAFAVSEQHRAAMELAPNPFEYDFSVGWPQTYADTLTQEKAL